MKNQENISYKPVDYLGKKNSTKIDKKYRFKMVEWFYQTITFFLFDRKTASLAISYLDRFLSTEQGNFALHDIQVFQLAAMCSLELAVKLNEPMKLDMKFLSDLSHGSYSVAEISNMERKILAELDWRMTTPMPSDFIDHFLELFPSTFDDSVKQRLRKLSCMQTEYAAKEYFFASNMPSSIALASVLNAIDAIDLEYSIKDKQAFHHHLIHIAGMDPLDDLIQNLQSRLHKGLGENFDHNYDESLHHTEHTLSQKYEKIEQSSFPVCVSAV